MYNLYQINHIKFKNIFSEDFFYSQGVLWMDGCVLENYYPVYGQVDGIIVWEDERLFVLTELEALYFRSHFMAYEVERSDNKAVVLHHDLPWHGVLHVVKKNEKKFIVEKDTSCVEDTI